MSSILPAILLSISICTAVPAVGQIAGVGLKAGATRASLGGESSANTAPIDYHLGILMPVDIRKNVQAQIELVLSRQGTKVDNDVRLRYNYIHVPIVGKFVVRGFYVETGAQVGRLHSARLVDSEMSVSVKDQIRSVDASFVTGAGYNVDSRSLLFGVRYTHGLTNTLKNDPEGLRFTNRTVQVFVGYLFL